jgi:hypothetical protein
MNDFSEELFEPTLDLSKMLMLDGQGVPSDTKLASAYLQSAQLIIEQKVGKPELDLLFFPVAFLLRHALELELKATIRRCWRINKRPSSYEMSHHELDTLAHRLDVERKRMEIEPLQASTRKVIAILDNVDPKGDRFRFNEVWNEDAPNFEQDDAKYFDIHSFYNKIQEALWDIEYTWEIIKHLEEGQPKIQSDLPDYGPR